MAVHAPITGASIRAPLPPRAVDQPNEIRPLVVTLKPTDRLAQFMRLVADFERPQAEIERTVDVLIERQDTAVEEARSWR